MTIRELHDGLRRLLSTNPEFAGAGVAVAEGDGDGVEIEKLVLNRDQETGAPVLIIQTGAFSTLSSAIGFFENAGKVLTLIAMEFRRLAKLGVAVDPSLGPTLIQLLQELGPLLAAAEAEARLVSALVDGEPDGGSGEEPPTDKQGCLVRDEEV